jgi:hypothetical protein
MQVDWAAFRSDAVPDLTGVRYRGYGEFRPSIFLKSLFGLDKSKAIWALIKGFCSKCLDGLLRSAHKPYEPYRTVLTDLLC